MKIALIQQKAGKNIAENLKNAMAHASEAAKNGAQIISFAELAFTPFYPQKPAHGDIHHLAETIPGPTTDLFSRLAQDNNIVVILNLFEKEGNKTYDSSPVISTNGEIMGITRMVHITDYACFHEQDYYYPGDTGAPVYDTTYGKIGVAICYDRHYPEYMRALALKGAEIVFVPQAGAVGEWPDGLYEAEMRVAAFQNGYFTALCNRVGSEECLTFGGESFICDPFGEVIVRAHRKKEKILYSDIDLKKIEESHAKKLFLKDRRPELYAEWLSI
jgi:predicted amidohydrolase